MPEYYDFISKIYYALIDESKAIKGYTQLIGLAPEEDIEIIKSIKEDEEKHYRMFLSMYMSLTYQLPPTFEIDVKISDDYLTAVEDSISDELHAAKYYMQLVLMTPNYNYKEKIQSIIVDEQVHAVKFEHIYTKGE